MTDGINKQLNRSASHVFRNVVIKKLALAGLIPTTKLISMQVHESVHTHAHLQLLVSFKLSICSKAFLAEVPVSTTLFTDDRR
jgi:hypothetical protein